MKYLLLLSLLIVSSICMHIKTYNQHHNDDQDQFTRNYQESLDQIPITASQIKIGGFAMLKTFPCKVTELYTSKPGKTGSIKVTIIGTDIFTGLKYEQTMSTTATVNVPIVRKVEYQVAHIDENDYVILINNENGQSKNDLKLPIDDQETYNMLKTLWEENKDNGTVFFTVMSAINQEKIVSGRVIQE